MRKRNKKRGIISSLFSSLSKFVFIMLVIVVGSFILLTGSISMNVSFNKDKAKPMDLLEKTGRVIKLVKTGYNTVNDIVK